ncbi:hypothetical protein MMC11_001500 [Xylographa trunciseda]|nr:hypothetical protein [Xylographa trunciseda]
MEASSLVIPRTPNRATSEGPTPPPRNSMEDADSSVTRKRPRLDSGDRALRSMSADGKLSTQPRTEPGKHLPQSDDSDLLHDDPEVQYVVSTNSISGTPTKVTINVRDPASSSSPPLPAGTGSHFSRHEQSHERLTSFEEQVSQHSSSSPQAITTTSPSPPGTPEIEVAELEDIDGHEGLTIWRTSGSMMDLLDLQQNLLHQFPYCETYENPVHALGAISNAMLHGGLGDGQLLHNLAIWIEDYLEQTKHAAPQWFNMFTEQRDFWEKFPNIVTELVRRSVKFEETFFGSSDLDDGPYEDNRQYLEDFLCAYAALTARMVQVDCQTLAENAEDFAVTPDLVSPNYLRVLQFLFYTARELPLWKMLNNAYTYSFLLIIESILSRFTNPSSDGLRHMSQYVDLILDRSQSQPTTVADIWQPINTAGRIASNFSKINTHSSSTDMTSPVLQTFQFFRRIEAKIQNFITKQVSSLSLELTKALLTELTSILNNVLGADSSLAEVMLPTIVELKQETNLEDRVMLAQNAWRFTTCKNCIMKGRMEIRVFGIETMQDDLVAVFQRYINKGPKELHMIPDYLSDAILSSRLVDYLVGVDSHPQLIHRSRNIVGFLVVTHKYTEVASDVIWKSVSSSQDSRTIDAILEMLQGILNLMDYGQLLYLCRKLNDLPMRYFDPRMLVHCKLLLENLVRKWAEQGVSYGTKLDMPPYHLCLRLLRTAVADTSLIPNRKREICQFALEELRSLTKIGPTDADRASICKMCIDDISKRSPRASGSMAAINVLLDQNTEDNMERFVDISTFTALMIGELATFTDVEASTNASSPAVHDALSVRLSLLQKIIIYAPNTITPDLAQKFWESMLGERALDDHARDSAWGMLAKALSSSHMKNSFLDLCVTEQLPLLKPCFFTLGVLSFAEKVVQHETRSLRLLDAEERSMNSPPGAELLWHLALVVPNPIIGSKAASMLVKSYLNATFTQGVEDPMGSDSNAKLVERCIQQLIQASSRLKKYNDGTSSGEEDSMVIVPSEDDVSAEKICFARSLSILKEFMQEIRTRYPASPASASIPQSPYSINGDKVDIQYQGFNGSKITAKRFVEFGNHSTYADFVTLLTKLTGFSKFSLIAGGQRVDYATAKDMTIEDLKLSQKGLLLVRKIPDAEASPEQIFTAGLTPLEAEVMKHFHELYELLSMEEQQARDVYDFLGTFPPHEDIIAMVCYGKSQTTLIFAHDEPYKTLYSVYALKYCLARQLQEGTSSHHLICRGVQSIVAALVALHISSTQGLSRSETMTAVGLIECLLKFLKGGVFQKSGLALTNIRQNAEPVPLEISAMYFSDPPALIDRLRLLIFTAQESPITAQTIWLVEICFSAMLEASLYSKASWSYLRNHSSSPRLLRCLLLESPHEKIREGAVASVRRVCGAMPSLAETDAQDFISFFWSHMVTMIPETVNCSQSTEQFFNIALEVFRHADELRLEQMPLASYLQTWSELLLEHRHDEFVGRDGVDWIIYGITGLLHWCVQLMKSSKRPLDIDATLVEKIFRTHLFPNICVATSLTLAKPRVPVLDSPTRGRVYSVLLSLSTDMAGYRNLLSLVKDLLPQGEEDSYAWSWGIAQILEDYHYESNWNFDRMKSVRSPTGYPGLKNLSNTCYLNSLFTQLFMNVSFRGFMLNRSIADAGGSQKLLSETQRLFGYMQESWLKCVDPQGIADSVITYENSPIDVSIQMDVDEFYNLLFDRWESQIPSAVDKKTFREFYGGQIVQQIKSKECPHISERLEPFSAIQCEVRGKGTLAESLNAYIEGEVMEGDNKYSCSACGSYVDAVKRACLKDIPNNLIFHLKRFDYDVSTGMRSKINDHFEFPHEIDMSPYDVEYLKGPNQSIEEDRFVLVGVLVHSGNAESGHYYSYIRERPANSEDDFSWVEYNDADVGRFDPANIPDQCFGGLNEPIAFSTMRFPKTWNAYMLFYQRARSMEYDRQMHLPILAGNPAKEHIPLTLGNRIVIENELFVRKFCLFDAEHAKFVKHLLDHFWNLNKGLCSDGHVLEKEVLWLTLEHLDQVFSRAKDCPEFHIVLNIVTKIASACPECCRLTLDWVSHQSNALRNLLLRCPDEEIRRKFAKMVIGGLKFLRDNDTRLYGIDIDNFEREPTHESMLLCEIPQDGGALHNIVRRLKEFWQYLHLHSRAWDEYYDLCTGIAQFGRVECAIMHREGFLTQCLQVLVVDYNHTLIKRLRLDNPPLAHLFRMIDKGRKFSLKQLLALLATLLRCADFTMEGTDDTYDSGSQFLLKHGYPLQKQEEALIRFGETPRSKGLVFLDKVVGGEHNTIAAQNIVRILTLAESELQLSAAIQLTLVGGINIDPASGARPYLQAALAFCETCTNGKIAKHVLNCIAVEVETIGHSGGEEHLEFFKMARRIRNESLAKLDPAFFHNTVLKLVPRWAPTLLIYPDPNVRQETIQLLHTLVFSLDIRSMDDEEKADEVEDVAKQLCTSCLKRIQESVIMPNKQIEARTVEEIVKVVRHCVRSYFPEEDEESPSQFLLESEAILDRLQTLTVSSPDDALSAEYDSDEVATDYSENYT